MRQERKAPVKLLFHSDFMILSHMYYICDKTAKPEWNSNAFASLHRPTMFFMQCYIFDYDREARVKQVSNMINQRINSNTKMKFIHDEGKIF